MRPESRRRDSLHLNVGLTLNMAREVLALYGAQALVTGIVSSLKLHVSRRPRSQEHGQPISDGTALREGTMTIDLGKLVRVQVLPRRLASRDEEEVVPEEASGVRKRKQGVKEHSEGYSLLCPSCKACTETDIVFLRVETDVREAECQQKDRQQ